jgi:hypothetical protein
VGTQYFPAAKKVPFIVKEHVEGAFYLFDRLLATGIRGHVFDYYTKEPLLAEIEVLEFASQHVNSRITDWQFGSFYRILNSGVFTVQVVSEGYVPEIIKDVEVDVGEYIDLEVGLFKEREISNGSN